MRILVSGSGILVLMTLLVLIHTSVLNKNIRDIEINDGLESAVDYALDVMADEYDSLEYGINEYDDIIKEKHTEKLVSVFCDYLLKTINTDGEIEVYIMDIDLKKGIFDVLVEERYNYTFKNRSAVARCERAVVLL